jgi:hypothetical protein
LMALPAKVGQMGKLRITQTVASIVQRAAHGLYG